MKKIALILLLSLCFVSCYSQKSNSDIIYFLPPSVIEIISKELNIRNDKNDAYLVMDKQSADTYILYLSSIDSAKNFWSEHSDRSVFIKGRLIPLYFYWDEILSYAENGENVLKKLGTEELIKKTFTIRDNVFNIKFKLNGEIVK